MENNLIDKFNIRIENLGIRKASYLLPKDEWPKNPAFQIIKIQDNPYYHKEQEYEWSEDGEFAFGKLSDGSRNEHWHINKSCFKSKETNFAIAEFEYDEHKDFYELHFVGDRPLDLDDHEREIFWNLIKIGHVALNSQSHTEY